MFKTYAGLEKQGEILCEARDVFGANSLGENRLPASGGRLFGNILDRNEAQIFNAPLDLRDIRRRNRANDAVGLAIAVAPAFLRCLKLRPTCGT